MKIITAFILMALVFNAQATEMCNKVVSGYESQDVMYVLCNDLSSLSSNEASQLIVNVFNQYKGPPDEILVYFVAAKELVGNPNIKDNKLVGSYYTHNNNLVIWPNSKTNKREIQIKW